METETEIIEFEVGTDQAGRQRDPLRSPRPTGGAVAKHNRRMMLMLLAVVLVACLLLYVGQLVFSFNLESYSPLERQVPYFHPRYLGAFLNWAFNLHLDIQPYLSGQRFGSGYDYVRQFWSIVTMLAASGGLAAAGASYQGVFNNPLASPDLLGVSAGTQMGGVIAFVLMGFGYYGSFTFGLLIGVFTIAMIFLFGKLVDRGNPRIITLLLCGVALTQLYNAVIALITSGVLVFDPADEDSEGLYDKLQPFLQSHFDGRANWLLIVIVLTCGFLLFLMSWRLNALAFGDEEARGMGLNPGRIRHLTLWIATVLTVVVVSQCGPLGFVGLVAPHIARRLVGQNYRWVIPASILVGCAFVAIACFVFQFFGDDDVNSVTTMIGVPYFVKILLDIRRRQRAIVPS